MNSGRAGPWLRQGQNPVIRYECDKCGALLRADDGGRFILKMEVFAAAGRLDLAEESEATTTLDEVIEEIKGADPDDVEDKTYRCLRFDLCNECRAKVLKKPLG